MNDSKLSSSVLLPLLIIGYVPYCISNTTTTDSKPARQGECGPNGDCDYLVTISLFQVGTCGRAARCNWELWHLKKYLLGIDDATLQGNIRNALCRISTFKMYKNITKAKKKDQFKIFSHEHVADGNDGDDEFDDFPMPTLYLDRNEKILPAVNTCRNMEIACMRSLDEKIDELCSRAMTPQGIEKIEKHFHLKVRNKPFYRIDLEPGQNNKCSLKMLIRKKTGKTISSYKDSYEKNYIHPKMRPPYFDLYLLYLADPDHNMEKIPEEDRYWNETKAYPELATYLPKAMVNSMHEAIEHVYISRGNLLSHNGLKKAIEWKPQKFCWHSSTLVCVDERKLNKANQVDCSVIESTDDSQQFPDPGGRQITTKEGEATTEEAEVTTEEEEATTV